MISKLPPLFRTIIVIISITMTDCSVETKAGLEVTTATRSETTAAVCSCTKAGSVAWRGMKRRWIPIVVRREVLAQPILLLLVRVLVMVTAKVSSSYFIKREKWASRESCFFPHLADVR